MKHKSIAIAAGMLITLSATAQSELLHYNKPAQYFEEALPIGNGTQGAMVYSGIKEEKISLNDITLWTGEPDKEVYSPNAYKYLQEVRDALNREDYAAADKLQRKLQGHYTQNYQPLGTLYISDADATQASNYTRQLDLTTALVNMQNGNETREYFASAPDSVIIIRISSKDGNNINKIIRLESQQMHTKQATTDKMNTFGDIQMDGYAAWVSKPSYHDETGAMQYDSNRGIHFRTIVRVLTNGGSIARKDFQELQITGSKDVTILIANVTSFNGSDKDPVKEGRDYKTMVANRIEAASNKAYNDMKQSHIADYQQFYNRVSLDLGATNEATRALTTEEQIITYSKQWEEHKANPKAATTFNPDLEELYFNFGRYLLICCSRTEGVPANLQGLWNEKMLPPWSCNYTANINAEENYWPAEVTGLGEMHNSLLTFIDKLPVTGKVTAQQYYNVQNGWCLGHNTDIWAITNPVGEHAGDANWANWNMGGAWMVTHLWEHYTFTQDKDFLSKAYPTLKGAADFCMDWLIEKDGHLITSPSTSPENEYVTDKGVRGFTCYGGFSDIAMIKECLIDTRKAALIVGESKEYIAQIDKTLAKLLPYRIGKKGNLQEWYYDWEDRDPKHRHQSHLFGLYPGHHITVAKTPKLAAACKRSLEIKGDKTTGWSTGWRVNLQARLHEAEEAYNIYRMLFNYITPDDYRGPGRIKGGGVYPNMFDAHSPFQIDGNFGGTAGLVEMLVQSSISDNGKVEIELLPALPKAWKAQGSLNGVRARGGYELSFSWKNGKITSLNIKDIRPAGGSTQSVSIKGGGKSASLTTKPYTNKNL